MSLRSWGDGGADDDCGQPARPWRETESRRRAERGERRWAINGGWTRDEPGYYSDGDEWVVGEGWPGFDDSQPRRALIDYARTCQRVAVALGKFTLASVARVLGKIATERWLAMSQIWHPEAKDVQDELYRRLQAGE